MGATDTAWVGTCGVVPTKVTPTSPEISLIISSNWLSSSFLKPSHSLRSSSLAEDIVPLVRSLTL